MTVGEKIQFYRKQKNLSQEQLGELLFVSRQTVSLWEKDQTLPAIDNLLKLKEVFGVSVDELLSGEAQIEQEAQRTDEKPMESFSVTYRKDDIRRAISGSYKNMMILYPILSAIILMFFVVSLIEEDAKLSAITGGALLAIVIGMVIVFLNIKRIIQIGEQNTVNSVYHYDIYERHIEIRTERNGEQISTRKILFSEISKIQQYGDIIMFQYTNQLFFVHTTDLGDNSYFYRSLRSRSVEEHKPKINGGLTVASILLIVLSILSSLLAMFIMITDTSGRSDPFHTSFVINLFIALGFLPIQIGSIVFGAVTRRNGYDYKQNTLIGIIMAVALVITVIVLF